MTFNIFPGLDGLGNRPRLNCFKSITLCSITLFSVLLTPDSVAAPNNVIQVINNAVFNNFERINLTIDVPEYGMSGQYRFVKIYDDLSNTLFLGSVLPTEAFHIPVNTLKAAKKITVELFSESTLDVPVVLTAQLN